MTHIEIITITEPPKKKRHDYLSPYQPSSPFSVPVRSPGKKRWMRWLLVSLTWFSSNSPKKLKPTLRGILPYQISNPLVMIILGNFSELIPKTGCFGHFRGNPLLYHHLGSPRLRGRCNFGKITIVSPIICKIILGYDTIARMSWYYNYNHHY